MLRRKSRAGLRNVLIIVKCVLHLNVLLWQKQRNNNSCINHIPMNWLWGVGLNCLVCCLTVAPAVSYIIGKLSCPGRNCAIMMGRFVHGKSPITLMAAHSTSQRPARSLGLQKATPNPWLPAISKWTCKQEACLPKSNSVKEALLKSRRAHILRKPGCFNICYKIWFVCLLHPDLDKEKLAIVIDILVIDALVYRCGVTLKIVGKLQLVQNSF